MAGLRARLYHQLHVGAWPDGRLTALNLVLIFVILGAVGLAVAATESAVALRHGESIATAEYVFGLLFLIEYLARVYAAAEAPGPHSALAKRIRFMVSPLGLIDLFVVVVSLAPMVLQDAHSLRLLRLLRIFAIAKLGHFSAATRQLVTCIMERRYDLLVCLAFVFVVLLAGSTAMFFVEGRTQPEAFGSIPRALWWAVTTLTTVGYGDVYPTTAGGKIIGAVMALTGILVVAMPTGIIAAAFSDAMQRRREEIADRLAGLTDKGE